MSVWSASPDTRFFSIATRDKLLLDDVQTGKTLWELPTHHIPLPMGRNAITFSSAGRLLAACLNAEEGTNAVIEVRTGRTIRTLPGILSRLSAFAFSPDGRKLVARGEGTIAYVWDVTGGADAEDSSKLTQQQLAKLFDDLAHEETFRAYRAL
jgi:WD40 repeat protein